MVRTAEGGAARPPRVLAAISSRASRRLQAAGALTALFFFALASWALHDLLGHYRYRDIALALGAIPVVSFAAALLLTAAAYVVMMGYDVLGMRFAGRALALRHIAFGSFVSCAFTNNVGNTVLTGGPIRYWIYGSLGLTAVDVAKIVIFCSLAFWLGYLLLAGVVFSLYEMAIPASLAVPFESTRALGAVLIAALTLYVAIVSVRPRRLMRIPGLSLLPSARMTAGQLGVSSLDILATASALYVLLPHSQGLSYAAWLPIFMLALVAGSASQVPGGLGVFEAVVLLLIAPYVPLPRAAAALLAFRVVYCVLPLSLAAGIVALRQVGRHGPWLRAVLAGVGRARPRHEVRYSHATAQDIERARPIVQRSLWTYANLVYRHDKNLVFSDSGNGFLMYAQIHRTRVAMGDPVGPPGESRELISRFHALTREARCRPVFFEVREDNERVYRELGLTLTKLGEEARVELARFDIDTHEYAELRQARARVQRRDCRFEIVSRPNVPKLMPQFLQVSESWLDAKATAEKGFSNASFDAEYLSNFPVALVRGPQGVIAFANLWESARKEELSVDLMRHVPEAPNGTMDFLFTEVLLWGRSQGYRWFNFGVAPLSGLEKADEVTLWDRVGTLLYRHGEHFYNFQGLRHYKDKFRPVWTPRYLASPGGLALPVVLLDVTALVAGGVSAIVTKRRRNPL